MLLKRPQSTLYYIPLTVDRYSTDIKFKGHRIDQVVLTILAKIIWTKFRDLAYLLHQGNINEDISMKNKYTFPILENFENK